MSTQNTKLLLNKSNNGEKSATWFDDDGKKRERKHAPLNDDNPYGCRAPLRCLFDSCSYLAFLLTTLHLHPFPIICHNFFIAISVLGCRAPFRCPFDDPNRWPAISPIATADPAKLLTHLHLSGLLCYLLYALY